MTKKRIFALVLCVATTVVLDRAFGVSQWLSLTGGVIVYFVVRFGNEWRPSSKPLPLPPGTKVMATCDFGPVKEGAPGIITGAMEIPFFFWKRQTYLCTFADNVRISVRPHEIDDFDHSYSLSELEQPHLELHH